MTIPACFGRAGQKSGIRPSGNGILKPENRSIPIGNIFPGERGCYEVMVVHDQKKEEWYCEVWRNADQSAVRIKNGELMDGSHRGQYDGSSD